MSRRSTVGVVTGLACLGVLACATRDAGTPARSDSVASAASGWSDAEVASYIGSLAAALASDGPTVTKYGRRTGVRRFAERLATEHRALARTADSLATVRGTRTPAPREAVQSVERHRQTMQRTIRSRDFDVGYLRQVRTTVGAALGVMWQARLGARSRPVTRLIDRVQDALEEDERQVTSLQRAIDAAPRPRPAGQATRPR